MLADLETSSPTSPSSNLTFKYNKFSPNAISNNSSDFQTTFSNKMVNGNNNISASAYKALPHNVYINTSYSVNNNNTTISPTSPTKNNNRTLSPTTKHNSFELTPMKLFHNKNNKKGSLIYTVSTPVDLFEEDDDNNFSQKDSISIPIKEEEEEIQPIEIFQNNSIKLLILLSGVSICYILQSVVKEYLFINQNNEKIENINFPLLLALFQCFFHVIFSLNKFLNFYKYKNRIYELNDLDLNNKNIFIKIKYLIERIMPLKPFLSILFIGILGDLSMMTSNYSLNYINYPTYIIIKSSKLIIAIIFTFVFLQNKKERNYYEIISGILICGGLITLSLDGYKLNNEDDIYSNLFKLFSSYNALYVWGMILAFIGMTADAFVSITQEIVLKKEKQEPIEVVFISYSFGFLLLFIYLLFTNQFIISLQFCFSNPNIMLLMILYCLLGHFAILFQLDLTKHFGALVSLIVATVRKVFTICLSFLIFFKPFSQNLIISVILVFTGVSIHIFIKHYKQIIRYFNMRSKSIVNC